MKIKHIDTSIYALISCLGILGLLYTLGNVVMPYYVAPLNRTVGELKRAEAQGTMDAKAISEVISDAEKARAAYYSMLRERNCITGFLSGLLILTSSVCACVAFKQNKRPNKAPQTTAITPPPSAPPLAPLSGL